MGGGHHDNCGIWRHVVSICHLTHKYPFPYCFQAHWNLKPIPPTHTLEATKMLIAEAHHSSHFLFFSRNEFFGIFKDCGHKKIIYIWMVEWEPPRRIWSWIFFFIWIFQWIGNSKWILSRPIAVFLKYNYEMFRLLNVINSDVKLKILLQYCMQKPFKQS